jgi:hypothetical protein
MTEPLPKAARYQVSYSGQVRAEIQAIGARARAKGVGQAFVDALKAMDYRLRVFPQFGEPLRDLLLSPSKMWIGVIFPLVLHYSVDDERRVVMVASPVKTLPRCGF